jgi:hypothetical protein
MNTQSLIASAPAELVLGLGIFFGLAAIILFALAMEAGNYRDLTRWLRDTWNQLSPRHYRRHWYATSGI